RSQAVDVDRAALCDDALRDEDDRERVRGRPEEERDLPPGVALDEVPVALDHPVEADELVPKCPRGFSHANTPLSSLSCASLTRGKPCFPRVLPSLGIASPCAPLRSPRTAKSRWRETSRFPGALPPSGVRPLTRTHPAPHPRPSRPRRSARSPRRTPPRGSRLRTAPS